MASSSSSTSSIQKRFKYEVFLSFRGADTRNNFVGHLYNALQQKSIETYKDDEKIKKGENISNELITSIENSKFYIIVFSKNYASSRWCLNELVKIMECQRTADHTAYPLFYDVEPSEVRKQSGAVKEAFVKNEKKEAAGKWREALREAADLAGWELKNTANGDEAKLIKKIVEELSLALRCIRFNIDEDLVGMESRMKEVLSSFGTDSNDVRMIGIKGMGGGGKTTLARAVYDHISYEFEGKSFVENVREVSKTSLSGLKSLQCQLLSDVFNGERIHVSSVSDGKHMMKRRMCDKKVLVVLDDVDHIDQLQALAGEPNWFKIGSRIIITTRDEQVLVAHGVKFGVKFSHDVNLLSDKEATFLFCKYAFGKDIPTQGYEELSKQVVRYADGLPLTIKVLGSDLCGQNVFHWKDVLKRLEKIPLQETQKKLEISYMGLEEDHKEIFLDVASLFNRIWIDHVIKALESCGFHSRSGLRVLEQKSLITVDCYGYIVMHDHIAEMGRNIVRRSHPPHEHSRLWDRGEIEDIFANDLGTEATRCIQLYTQNFSPCMVVNGLRKMKQLRFLYVFLGKDCFSDLEFDIVSPDFPNALQYLEWTWYPFRSLPTTFQANNLVTLKMRFSRIVQLWEGEDRKVLSNLKNLDVSFSRLMSTLDLRLLAPNLEMLELKVCTNLVELHMPVDCLNLTTIKISKSLLRTLDLGQTPNIEVLDLTECKYLEELHMKGEHQNLTTINISRSKLRTLDLGQTPNIEVLDLTECKYLEELHMKGEHQNLTTINISRSKLRTLDLGQTPNIEVLDLTECKYLEELHMKGEHQNLTTINISRSKLRTLDLGQTPNIEVLDLTECNYLEELHMKGEHQNLTIINISRSKLRTLDLGQTPNIEELDLTECNYLEELHMPVDCLNLTTIKISRSLLRTLDLGQTPNIEVLVLTQCNYLEELHMKGEHQNLTTINISRSKLRTLDLGHTPNIEELDLTECNYLEELHMPVDCLNLTTIKISRSLLRTLDLGQTPNIEVLDLTECKYLEELHMKGEHQNLYRLKITCSKLRSLDIGLTPNLEQLTLTNSYELEDLQMSDGCQKLIDIDIRRSKLRTFDLGKIPNVKMLDLTWCNYLEELQIPNGCPKSLVNLELSGSLRFTSFKFYIAGNTYCSENASESHEALEIGPLAELQLIVESLESCRQHPGNNLPKFHFNCLYKEDRPSSTRNLEILLSLGMCACTDLETFSRSICGLQRLRKLKLGGSILEAPLDLGQLKCLEELILSSTKINHLPDSICMLKNLHSLNLNACLLLEELPEDIGQLECLEELILSSTVIKHLPDSICMLKRLQSLQLIFCWLLEKFPDDVGELKCLKKLELSFAKIKRLPDSICMLKNLKSLNLNPCMLLEELPEDLGRLECLEELILSSTVIKHLPDSICMLKHLKNLELHECSLLEKLPGDLGRLERLEDLELSSAKIKHLPNSICMLKHLKSLKLNLCLLLEKLPEDVGQLGCLEKLTLSSSTIEHLPDSICMLKRLQSLKLRYCWLLEKLPEDVGRLKCLKKLELSSTKIKHLPESICRLKHLKYLKLNPCLLLEKLPENVGQLECLEKLILSSTVLKHLPDSICMSKQMKHLDLHKCSLLEKLPRDLGQLEGLQWLIVSQCETLQDIPNSICDIKCLNLIYLQHCIRVGKLPEELGRLERLNVLNIEGTSISHLSQHILLLKDLRIIGSRGLLESCGFTSEIQVQANIGTSCYVVVG